MISSKIFLYRSPTFLASRYYSSAKRKRLALGIDLGTTNSCAAISQEGKISVVKNEGKRTTPSVVHFPESGGVIVGNNAKKLLSSHPVTTIFGSKRLIGRRFDEASIQADKKALPYQIVEGPTKDAWVAIRDRKLSPSEIGALILSHMRKSVEEHAHSTVSDLVVTVPAYFNDSQRQATKDAGKIAGLNVTRIINEPTAAALAYGVQPEEGKIVAVFDFGGGTFDISILEIVGGVFEVKATNGNTALGGQDCDNLIVETIKQEMKKKGIDMGNNAIAMQRLIDSSEQAKIDLSSTESTNITLPYIAVDDKGSPKHFEFLLTRNMVEEICRPVIEKTIDPCKRCLKDSGLRPEGIDEIILVGGMTQMPLVQKLVEEIFGKPPTISAVDPDEAVAVGAAVQAAMLLGEINDLLLLDVTPLSLGIETLGGVFSRLIDRNTTVPTEKTQTFSTAVDSQTQVNIRVFQGERELVMDNKLLGQFDLIGIPPMAKGIPQIDVTFAIDADGIMHVSAVDALSGKKQEIKIEPSGGLSKQELEKIIAEAEQHREKDNEKKEAIEAALQLESYINAAKIRLAGLQNDVSKQEKQRGKNLLEEAENAVKSQKATKINLIKNELSQFVKCGS